MVIKACVKLFYRNSKQQECALVPSLQIHKTKCDKKWNLIFWWILKVTAILYEFGHNFLDIWGCTALFGRFQHALIVFSSSESEYLSKYEDFGAWMILLTRYAKTLLSAKIWTSHPSKHSKPEADQILASSKRLIAVLNFFGRDETPNVLSYQLIIQVINIRDTTDHQPFD